MIDSLVAITFVALLAGALHFVLARQSLRRIASDIDLFSERLDHAVSTIERLSSETEHQISSLGAPVEPDLTPIADRIEQVEMAIIDFSISQSRNVHKLERRLDKLVAVVADIPYPLRSNPVSLEPVTERLDVIEKKLAGIAELMSRRAPAGHPVVTRHKLTPDS